MSGIETLYLKDTGTLSWTADTKITSLTDGGLSVSAGADIIFNTNSNDGHSLTYNNWTGLWGRLASSGPLLIGTSDDNTKEYIHINDVNKYIELTTYSGTTALRVRFTNDPVNTAKITNMQSGPVNFICSEVQLNGSALSSDDRIKYNEEIFSGTSALAMINQLVPQKYEKISVPPYGASGTWIPTDAEWPSVKDNYVWNYEAGLIAQDIRAIPGLSFAVSGEEVNAEGTQTILHLNYNDVYAYHIAATKELSSQLDAEKVKTSTLETQVLDLTTRLIALENP